MGNINGAALAMAIILAFAGSVHGQTMTPPEAQATLEMARVQATGVSRLATANAPTSTPIPTWTPAPTATPLPTWTPTIEPTSTPQPTWTATAAKVAPIVATAASRSVDARGPAKDTGASSLIDTLVKIGLFIVASVVMLVSAGALMRMVGKWLNKR